MEVTDMFARSQSSHRPHPLRLAILIGCLGALLAGFGVYRMKQGTEDSWQPLNAGLNALLTEEASESALTQQAVAPTDTGDKSAAETASKPNAAETSLQAETSIAAQEDAPTARLSATEQPPSASNIGHSNSTVSADGRIDINHATAQQLDELPGIGPAKAAAIVADRETNGPFRSVDDLDRVKGIGAKMIEKLRASVVALP